VSGNLLRGLGTSAAPGDHAFALFLKTAAEEFSVQPLEEEYYPDGCTADCAPRAFRVAAVLDLNGDGRMEVVVAFRDYEGGGKTIYTVTGSRANPVLSWRCGA